MSLNENVMAVVAVLAIMAGTALIGAGFNDAGDGDNDALFRILGVALFVAAFLVMVWLTHAFYELNIGFVVGLVLLFGGLSTMALDTSLAVGLLGAAASITAVLITKRAYERGKARGDWG